VKRLRRVTARDKLPAVADDALPTGIYESLLTQDLLARLADLRAITADVPEGQQASALGDHVGRRVTKAPRLRGLA